MNKNTADYLTDLGLTFSTPTIDFINNLQQRHLAKYSFNNLAVLLKNIIHIDSQSVFNKIVKNGRGGYCFEHNKLVFDVLKDLGFNVKLVIAKVVNDEHKDAPRTHRITIVTIENAQYIVDTGFGPTGSLLPIKLNLDANQSVGVKNYRTRQNTRQNEVCFEVQKNNEYVTLYCFNFNTYTEADCLLGNFYSYQYPEATFVNHLVVSKIVSKKLTHKTLSLRNHLFFTITHTITGDSNTEIQISDWQLLQSILNNHFAIPLKNEECQYLFEQHIKQHFIAYS